MKATAKKTSGIALALAAAAMFAGCDRGGAPETAATAESMEKKEVAVGKCFGINSCKGSGACATASSACAGQNACKGQGWLALGKDECEGKGGRFET